MGLPESNLQIPRMELGGRHAGKRCPLGATLDRSMFPPSPAPALIRELVVPSTPPQVSVSTQSLAGLRNPTQSYDLHPCPFPKSTHRKRLVPRTTHRSSSADHVPSRRSLAVAAVLLSVVALRRSEVRANCRARVPRTRSAPQPFRLYPAAQGAGPGSHSQRRS